VYYGTTTTSTSKCRSGASQRSQPCSATRGRAGSCTAEGASQGQGESDALKAAPLPLKLVDRQAIPRFLLSVGDEGDDGCDSGSPRRSESPPNLEDPDLVGVKLSGPAETEGDSANDDDEQEVQASEPQERPRLSLSIPPSPPSTKVLPTAIVHGTVDVLVPLASKKDVDNLEKAGVAVRDDQWVLRRVICLRVSFVIEFIYYICLSSNYRVT
jgi:hypothetical protein